MLQIGLRAHDYGHLPPEQLADTLAAFSPASIQLALAKAFPGAPGPGALSPGYARRIRKIFEERNIAVAVLGCYINPVHPDPEEREKQLLRFEEHLRYARDFGCAVVGTETGSRNPDCSWHPDTAKAETFDLLCASAERLLRCAEKCGAVIGIEPVAYQHTLSSVELTEKFIRRLASPALGIIYDPVNLIPLDGLDETQEAFFTRAFNAFGDRIVAFHLKDFIMEGNKKMGDLPAGSGELDYPALFRLIAARKPGADLLLENSLPATAKETFAFLRKAAGKK